jgi:hypothetical protein
LTSAARSSELTSCAKAYPLTSAFSMRRAQVIAARGLMLERLAHDLLRSNGFEIRGCVRRQGQAGDCLLLHETGRARRYD